MIGESPHRLKPHSNIHKRRRTLTRMLAFSMDPKAKRVEYQAFKRLKLITIPLLDDLGMQRRNPPDRNYPNGKPLTEQIQVERWNIRVAPGCIRGLYLSMKNPNRGRSMHKKKAAA